MSRAIVPERDGDQALIERLSGELRPIGGLGATGRLLVGIAAGTAASTLVTALVLGLRPDLAQAVAQPMFWVKGAYTLAFAGLALWACERLGRPAAPAGGRLCWMVAPVLAVAAAAAWLLSQAAAPDQISMMMGATAGACPWLIVLSSLPPLAGLVWALRGLAPTRLRLTGLVAGLAAGGAGAAAYALHCTEGALPFLAVWYTVGILLAGLVGALVGPRLLRW